MTAATEGFRRQISVGTRVLATWNAGRTSMPSSRFVTVDLPEFDSPISASRKGAAQQAFRTADGANRCRQMRQLPLRGAKIPGQTA
jgi:hypothetical protein